MQDALPPLAPFSYPFSLRLKPYALGLTVAISAIISIVWVVVFFVQDSPTPVVIFAIIYNLHGIGIWFFFLWDIFIPLTRNPARIRIGVLWELGTTFFVTVVQFTINYASHLFVDPSGFTTLVPADSRGVTLGYSLFLSLTTIATHASGSGFIIPNSGVSLFLLAANAVFSVLWVSIAVAKILHGISNVDVITVMETKTKTKAKGKVKTKTGKNDEMDLTTLLSTDGSKVQNRWIK